MALKTVNSFQEALAHIRKYGSKHSECIIKMCIRDSIVGDSIDLEMRIYEGRQAPINKVSINGNDRLYEHVVRRELRTLSLINISS